MDGGPRKSVEAQPDGLLLHENLLFSLVPPHAGMRQYWRDFDALERWARSLPHLDWWQQFLRDRGRLGIRDGTESLPGISEEELYQG